MSEKVMAPYPPPVTWLALTHDERAAAVVAARNAQDPQLPAVLLAIVRNVDSGDALRQAAAETLATLADASGAPALLELLRDPDPDQRRQAGIGLAKLPGVLAVPALVQALTDSVNTIRNLAERALLAQLEVVRAISVPALVELLSHPVPLTRSPAARILGMTQDPRARQPLLAMLSDPEWLARIWAVKALGDLGDETVQPALAELLQRDGHNRVRAATCEAIGKLRAPAAESTLRHTLEQDNDEGVKRAATEALRRLGFEVEDEESDPFAE